MSAARAGAAGPLAGGCSRLHGKKWSDGVDSFFDSDDRRGHERFHSHAMVQYFIKKHSLRYMDCGLVDVSRSGMSILVPGPENLAEGMEVSLEITMPGSLEQITLRGTVQWMQPGERIRAGIRFESLLDPATMTRLLAC